MFHRWGSGRYGWILLGACMPRRPWLKFYPADWQADQALRLVGLEARGLWLECMCIMHRAEPYGHLVVNGRPVTDTQLALLAGMLPDRVPALMAELATAGVTSRNRAGVVYSRRMTRDEKRRKDGETAKITGTNVAGSRRSQAIEKKGAAAPTLKVVGKVDEQPPSPQMLEAREEEEKSSPSGEPKKMGSRLPAEFVMSLDWLSDGREARRRHSLPEIDLDLETERFENYWHAKPRKDGMKLDWHATWINWCLNAKGAANGTTRQSPHDSIIAAFERESR